MNKYRCLIDGKAPLEILANSRTKAAEAALGEWVVFHDMPVRRQYQFIGGVSGQKVTVIRE